MESKIRWSKNDLAEFARIRKNYNAKIERLRKADPDMAGFLPPKLKKEDIYSREDFKRAMRMASLFTPRGSERKVKFHGEEVPFYFKKQIEYVEKVENARRAIRRKQFKPERGQSSMAKEAEFMPMKQKGKRSLYDMMKYREMLFTKLYEKDRRRKMGIYKENYLRALREQLGPLAGPIDELLRSLPAELFVKAIEQDYDLSIDFIYDYVDAILKAERLYNRWFEYLRDWQPDKYTEEEQELGFESAYEDVMEEDWADITERSNPVKRDIAALEKLGKKEQSKKDRAKQRHLDKKSAIDDQIKQAGWDVKKTRDAWGNIDKKRRKK